MKPMSARLWGNDAEREQLRIFGRTDFLRDFGERGLGLALLISAQELPLPKIDTIEKMQAMPALFRNKTRILIGHRASVRRAEKRSSRRDFGLGQMWQAILFPITRNTKLQVRIAQLGRAANSTTM